MGIQLYQTEIELIITLVDRDNQTKKLSLNQLWESSDKAGMASSP